MKPLRYTGKAWAQPTKRKDFESNTRRDHVHDAPTGRAHGERKQMELRGCPWCGEHPDVVTYENFEPDMLKVFEIKCSNKACPITAGVRAFDMIKAAGAWNERTPEGPGAASQDPYLETR